MWTEWIMMPLPISPVFLTVFSMSTASLEFLWTRRRVVCAGKGLRLGGLWIRFLGRAGRGATVHVHFTFLDRMSEVRVEERLPVAKVGGGPLEDALSRQQNVAAVAEVERDGGVLLHQQHRQLGLDPRQRLVHGLDYDRRQAEGWLVEHQKLWRGEKGPADGHHLLLST